MSIVMAIKDKDRVYMACDSQTTQGTIKHIIQNEGSCKIFRPYGMKNCLIGGVGLSNGINVLRYQSLFSEAECLKNEIDHEFIQNELCFRVRDIIKDKDLAGNNENAMLSSNYIICHKNDIYHINEDLCVKEYPEFGAAGCCKDVALGCLASSKDEDVKRRLIKAMIACCDNDRNVDFPLVIMNTKTSKVEVLDEKDCYRYLEDNE